MGKVTTRRQKNGKYWEYRFDGGTINGKRKQYSKSGFFTKRKPKKQERKHMLNLLILVTILLFQKSLSQIILMNGRTYIVR